MSPKPFDILFGRRQWKDSLDERPWLVIEVRAADIYGCFPISGQCYDGQCFELHRDHADFPATGLSKTCYVHDLSIYELHISELVRYKGRLEGELLREFRKYSGL